METLYYEITDNGYHIYDSNDEFFHIHQYEPYIPDKTKSYEENAQDQIRDLYIARYASLVYGESMIIDDVPEEYREAVAIAVEKRIDAEIKPENALTETEEKALAYDILTGVSE